MSRNNKIYEEMADKSMYSNCCGASPKTPLCASNTGFCSDCGEGASFSDEELRDYSDDFDTTESWEYEY